jgi:hypothetical protein
MQTKVITIVERTFEVGDLFIFEGTPVSGDAYAKGDFLLIKSIDGGIKFTTTETVAGTCAAASGDDEYLNLELGAGGLVYQGNIYKGNKPK